ncbi:MAG TPA: inorganic triphosphatase [Arsenophonus nasoniae]|uniref:CYTH domain-containing protein n=1 Tax=Arsenophonus nasoniae TaxID=638 RepID=UPI003878F5D2
MSHLEIELKLSVLPEAIQRIREKIISFHYTHFSLHQLSNTYFETVDHQLRRWDMGLRIRGCDGRFEMTIKTTGKVIGGLHQRPEYNVEIHKPEINLLAFPAEIWPKDTNVDRLQSQLTTLFYTDFSREKWMVTYHGSEIEIVLDQGSIYAGAKKKPIMEIELELKKGTLIELLALAKEFVNIEGLRLANKSKAERGYSLVQISDHVDTKLSLSHYNWFTMPIEQGLRQLLVYWQHYEECWLEDQTQARQNLSHLLLLIQKFLVHYAHSVPHFIRVLPLKEITVLLTATDIQPEVVCYSADWLRCKLAFTQWLTALTLP